jgi:hypothetical protein
MRKINKGGKKDSRKIDFGNRGRRGRRHLTFKETTRGGRE